jgi:fibronectin-binding autotransporter adhesin
VEFGQSLASRNAQKNVWTPFQRAFKIAPTFRTLTEGENMNSNRSAIGTVLCFIVAIGILGFACSTQAQDLWTAGDGDWFDGANWSTGVPTNITLAEVDNGGSANIGMPGAAASDLILGDGAADSGTVTLTDSATLAITNFLYVGGDGVGNLEINVDGSGVTVGFAVYVGSFSGSVGTVVVTGPDSMYSLTSGAMFVGANGNGTMQILEGAGVHTMGYAYIGAFSGSQGLVQVSGVNGLASEWTVDQRLSIGDSGQGELDVLDGGKVDPNRVAIGRLAGSNGLVVVDGAGSQLNSANDFYVGGDVGAAGGQGELDITNGGLVNVGDNMTVWGPGSAGSAILAVDSSYMLSVAGQLKFSGGTLRFLDDTDFTNDALLSIATGPVGMIVDNNGTTSTISGVLSGPGGLTVGGGGTLSITNFNSFTGDTIVNDATVLIDGSVGGNAIVNAGGVLGGTGFVSGDLLNTSTGVVAPGDSPGTLIVVGHYFQGAGADFSVEIGGLNAGVDSDLLNVFGTATIDGSMHISRVNNFMPLPGDEVTVLSTGGGVFGTFANVVPVNWLGLIQPVAVYPDPFTVDVQFVLANTFASQGLTPNQIAVGNALDNALLDNCAPNVVAYEGQVPLADLPATYDLIAPEELASIYEMGFSQAYMQGVNLMQRMDDIRAGSTGFCSTAAMQMQAPIYSKDSDGKEVINKNPAPAFVPAPENRWGIWVTGAGQFVNVGNDDSNATGYDLSNGDFLVGVDYRPMQHVAFGVYGGYDAGIANLVDNGRVTFNGGTAGGFATFSWNRFYADVSGGGAWNNYKTRRGALLGDAIGSTQGGQYNALGAVGYDWHLGCLNVGPRGTIQYTDVNIDHFVERGSLAPLVYPDQDEDSLQSTLGVRASYDIHSHSGKVIFRPELSLAWWHEFNDTAYPIDAGFLHCPTGFIVHGPNMGSDAAQIRAGGAAQLNTGFSIYVYYDGRLGRSNYNSNGVSGGFTWSF